LSDLEELTPGVHATEHGCAFLNSIGAPSVQSFERDQLSLPYDIVIKDLTDVEERFHARYDAKYKSYSITCTMRQFDRRFLIAIPGM
jgi:tRNA U38,U39,U40 pseudouridine synthase TruA